MLRKTRQPFRANGCWIRFTICLLAQIPQNICSRHPRVNELHGALVGSVRRTRLNRGDSALGSSRGNRGHDPGGLWREPCCRGVICAFLNLVLRRVRKFERWRCCRAWLPKCQRTLNSVKLITFDECPRVDSKQLCHCRVAPAFGEARLGGFPNGIRKRSWFPFSEMSCPHRCRQPIGSSRLGLFSPISRYAISKMRLIVYEQPDKCVAKVSLYV